VIPSPEIYTATQQGQDVNLKLHVYSDFDEDDLATFVIYLARNTHGCSLSLLDEHRFSIGDAIATLTACSSFLPEEEMEICEESPESCFDCDEDGTPECPEICKAKFTFEVIDECVPPGEAEYVLAYVWSDEEDGPYRADELLIQVENTGDPCLGADAESCSVAAVGGARPGAAITTILFLLGLTGLGTWLRNRLARRSRRTHQSGRPRDVQQTGCVN